jgi:hypothetical protein
MSFKEIYCFIAILLLVLGHDGSLNKFSTWLDVQTSVIHCYILRNILILLSSGRTQVCDMFLLCSQVIKKSAF